MGFFVKLKEKFFGSSQIKEATKTKEQKTTYHKKEDKVFSKPKNTKKYVAGLDKSSGALVSKLNRIFNSKNNIDDALYGQIEEILILSDLGYNLTSIIVEEIKKEVSDKKISNASKLKEIIVDKIFVIYSNMSFIDTTLKYKPNALNVILVAGVNGSGKTTTIAKLAHKLKSENKKVLLVAADTFRAAAVEQLEAWANKINVEIVKPTKEKQDPASVVYDGLEKAKDLNIDYLIVDTAGRLQNKKHLMAELEKMKKILVRSVEKENIENILIIDAINGQNGLSQAKEFKDSIDLDSIIITKMDGSAKGGIILNIKEQLNIPVKMVGLGEGIDDLEEFDLENYIYGLFKDWIDK